MTILAGDIKLVASAVMDDVDEGGGAPTAHVVADGSSNGIFNDISELDRAGGRVNLRKLFTSVQTLNTDGYFGANVIVAEPPSDPRVAVTLFTTTDTFDTRTSAKSRIESYLGLGPTYPGYLFGDHLAGQMTVTLLQREGIPLPVNSDTFILRKNTGMPTLAEQYVKAVRVTSRLRTFTDTSGDYVRVEVTVSLSDALEIDFPGHEASRGDPQISATPTKTALYSTVVADAARYYGVVPLTKAAAVGDYTIDADSIFTQLVPSTKVEIPIADARLNQQKAALLKAGEPYTDVLTLAFTTAQSMYIGAKVLPGTLTILRAGITLTDKGGKLMNADAQVGLVDYGNGVASLSTDVFGTSGGSHTVTYTPAATPTSVTSSIGIPVTKQGQRLTWTFSLDSLPARGTLQISYRALSRWYDLQDDGSGAIRGADASFGVGTVNFATGSVSLTLGALPDVDSQIVIQWAESASARQLSLIQTVVDGRFRKELSMGESIAPGTLTLTWTEGAATKTATDADGELSGDASGAVDYLNGRVKFSPNTLPAINVTVTAAYTRASSNSGSVPPISFGGGSVGYNVNPSATPRTAVLTIPVTLDYPAGNGLLTTIVRNVDVVDNGAGVLVVQNGLSTLQVGTINYQTGVATLNESVSGYKSDEPVFTQSKVSDNGGAATYSYMQTGWATVLRTIRFGNNAASVGSGTGTLTATTKQFVLDNLFLQTKVAPTGFVLGTSRYAVSGTTVVRNPSPLTGTGTNAGTLGSPEDGYGVVLTDWTVGVSSKPTALQGTEGLGVTVMRDIVTMRTAISPLFNGGFSVTGKLADGAAFNASPDSAGIISSDAVAGGVFGRVDFNTGVATLAFGTKVADSQAGQPGVLDLRFLAIPGVDYIISKGVKSDFLRYNAVAFTYLPLDPRILGLNPVRLPTDGKVPIFRPGSFAVIGHTGKIGPVTVGNGQTIDCARVRLSRIRVLDANNVVINTGYSTDLEAGHVTFNDVSGYAQPIVIEHRIEDMILVSDAQINGQLTFTRPVTHDYPLGSYVSSALIIGDMHARVSTLFDQQTWNNVWSDGVNGSDATGTYNAVLAPIEVSNKGALTERWAIQFTNTTSFNVIGEHVGVIATGSPSTDCAPLNPATGTPYFTIPAIGWGSGWSAGNVLRFNTVGACYPVWVVRTIQQGPATVNDDKFTLLIRGNVDQA